MYERKRKSVSAISTQRIISCSSTADAWKIHDGRREFKGWMCCAIQSIHPREVIWFWADSLTDWRRAAVTDVNVSSICSSDKHVQRLCICSVYRRSRISPSIQYRRKLDQQKLHAVPQTENNIWAHLTWQKYMRIYLSVCERTSVYLSYVCNKQTESAP